MAGTKISELTELTAPTGDEELVYALNGGNGKIKIKNMGGKGIVDDLLSGGGTSATFTLSGSSYQITVPENKKFYFILKWYTYNNANFYQQYVGYMDSIDAQKYLIIPNYRGSGHGDYMYYTYLYWTTSGYLVWQMTSGTIEEFRYILDE